MAISNDDDSPALSPHTLSSFFPKILELRPWRVSFNKIFFSESIQPKTKAKRRTFHETKQT